MWREDQYLAFPVFFHFFGKFQWTRSESLVNITYSTYNAIESFMSPKESPHKEYTLKIACKYLHPLHFYEFLKFDQFRHRRKRKNVPFCNFFPLCPQELESNHQFHFLHKDTSKPEPFIFEALMLIKYLIMQILWFAEHRSILPVWAIFFISDFWPRKGLQAVIFMLSTFRVGLKKLASNSS